ncbi:uncharacterized protein LOC124400339 [Silurus meridionalis]|uniref:uncharacterized protein LOC124400339 n=1 Tax=Silurus meridionalis TaxID=175797 RepID=UPI001EEB5353|nr:uncharacterized protein LOC124400339 [Silurus meridionalis]XP_046728047.1 uncharacterized protein LOC124400339 [Silurus meridionalis]XP_046728048.1 uncharacterized protein LOC124400339 [Silurus meridionalis]XP_046728049.1 uncharacterized protein LOC124400339 [Silurus meridionalis]XP_046728050.1 uncharacterized protein LOC124400339 [Silurus meridionalis]
MAEGGTGRGKYLMQFSDTKIGLGGVKYEPNTCASGEGYDINQTFPITSTPKPCVAKASSGRDTSEFGALVEELGRKIGDSVTARLLSGGGFARTSSDNSSAGSQCATLDLSQLNVVLKSDEKEPPVFRGDGSGKCNIQEWVDMMQRYLRKRNINVTEQADEIISHLMGRAKDIVKVALRSNSALDSKHHPEIIYSILKQHFSEVSYSSMPLADFYSTLPKHGENPVDYWLRLNKAADIANECLGAQGRKMDNLNSEVAMMFVRNCPDTELARIFKLRPLESWTAKDVHELLDSFQREQKSRVSANVYSACQNAQISLQKCENVDIGPEAVLSCFKQGTTRPDEPKPEAVDRSGLNRMAEMLAQLLEVLKNKEENKPAYVPFGKTRGKRDVAFAATQHIPLLTIVDLITCVLNVMLLVIQNATVKNRLLLCVLFQVHLVIRETESPAFGEGECG